MTTTEHERQRVAHLVLGQPRPKVVARKARRTRRPRVELVDGVEERVALRERWSHKQGTPETHEHAAQAREGSLARLYRSGAIDIAQLAAAEAIAAVHARIAADVTVRTASLETRIDAGRRGAGAADETAAQIARERFYVRWRHSLAGNAALVLAMVVEDVGIARAAARHGMHVRKAKRILLAALDGWIGGASGKRPPAS